MINLPYGQVEIEIQGQCNLKCVHCHQAFGIVPEDMRPDDVKRFYPLAFQAQSLVLQGGGEPLLNHNLEAYLRDLKDHNFIYFNTNGLPLTEEKARMILRNSPPLKMLSFSFDASTRDTYKKIRGGSFDKLMNNIKYFLYERGEKRYPEILLNMTVMRENLEEIRGLIDIAADFDKKVVIWPLQENDKFGGPDWIVKTGKFKFVYDDQVLTPMEFNAIFEAAQEYGKIKGVEVLGDMRTVDQPADIRECRVPKEAFMIRSNGDVFHCCHQTKPFMNWKENLDLPNEHPSHLNIISDMESGRIPEQCSGAGCRYVRGATSAPRDQNANLLIKYANRQLRKSRS